VIWPYVGLFVGLFVVQVALIGITWRLLHRATLLAARAGLAAANAARAMERTERAAACVPFPRRRADADR
jgi:hypothetical protein